jgi:hypothetical protein
MMSNLIVIEQIDGSPMSARQLVDEHAAEEHAVELALANVSYSEEEIRELLRATDSCVEGDYGVYLVLLKPIY